MDSEVVLQPTERNLMSSPQRVSDNFGISMFSVVYHTCPELTNYTLRYKNMAKLLTSAQCLNDRLIYLTLIYLSIYLSIWWRETWFYTVASLTTQLRERLPRQLVCRIHQLQKLRKIPQRVSWYDTKQSDDVVPAMQEFVLTRNTSSLPLLPGPLWSVMVAPHRALSMG